MVADVNLGPYDLAIIVCYIAATVLAGMVGRLLRFLLHGI
jgi:hypothetical protein